MSPDQKIDTLPKQYHVLKYLSSMRAKVHITDHLVNILDQLAVLEKGYVDPEVREKVRKFFVYFNNSCSNPVLLNNRAQWISCYIKIIHYHLLKRRYQEYLVSSSFETMITTNEALSNQVDLLVEEIKTYMSLDGYLDLTFYNCVKQIIEYSRTTLDVTQTNETYWSVLTKLTDLTLLFKQHTSCHSFFTQTGLSLLNLEAIALVSAMQKLLLDKLSGFNS